MFTCKRCNAEFRDGVQCTQCLGHFDYSCGGITEAGYRKLGDRKATWRCAMCKNTGTASPLPVPTSKTPASKSPVPADLESVMLELKRLTAQTASLPKLTEDIRDIKAELAALRSIKPELAEMRGSVDFMQHSMEEISNKVSDIDKEIHSLAKTKEEVMQLQQQVEKLQIHVSEIDQRARLNNLEIKGVPLVQSENLFEILGKIGDHIGCQIPKEQINFISRVPSKNNQNKNIIVGVHSRYLKEDFVAAAKKCSTIPADIGIKGDGRIFVNDHLTLENKLLLNKSKALAKERGFAYVWVKGCKIFARKSPNTPCICIKSQLDLKKIS